MDHNVYEYETLEIARQGIRALNRIAAALEGIQRNTRPVTHTTLRILIGDGMTAHNITVDDVNKAFALEAVDDKGDTDAAVPADASFTWSIKADPNGPTTTPQTTVNPSSGVYTPGPENDNGLVSCTSNGTAFERDGTTPIADPADAPFSVGPGGAVSLSINV